MGTAMLPAAFRGPGVEPPPAEPEIPGIPNPQLPLKLAFGDDYPDPQDSAAKNYGPAIGFLESRVQETQGECIARYRQAVLCTLYYASKQHVTWNNRRLEWEEMPMESDEIRVTYNLIRPIIRSRLQRLLSPKVAFSAMPKSNSMDERDKCRTASNWLNAAWRRQKMDDIVSSGMQLAMTGGCCALKSYWNNASGPLRTATMLFPKTQPVVDPATGAPVVDPTTGQPTTQPVLDPATGQPAYDELPVDRFGQPVEDERQAHKYRPGDTGTGLRSVFNIRVNPDARGWTAEEGFRWLIDEEMVPVSVERRRWPEHAQQIKEYGSLPALTYERMAAGAQTKRPVSLSGTPGTQSTSPGRELTTLHREYWQVPDDDYFPQGRLIVQIGPCVVYDDPFPQDVFPYTPMVDEPGILTPLGRPTIIDMLSTQDAVNREYTAAVQEMYDAGVGQFVSWDIPGIPEQISREPRAIMKVPMRTALANKSIKDVFTRLDPARSPADRFRIIELSERALYNIGAYHEVTRGSTPPGVDSGVAIKQLIEQELGQLALSFRAYKNSVLDWGRVQLGIARWGYGDDEERFIPVDRPDLGFQIEGVKGIDFPDPETIDLDLDNFKPTSEAENEEEIKWAFENQLIGGREALDALDMGRGLNSLFTSQTRHYARARMENLKVQRGEFTTQTIDPATGLPVDPNAPPPPKEAESGAEDRGEPGEEQPQQAAAPVTMLYNLDGTPFFLPTLDDHMIHILVHQEIALDDTRPVEERAMIMAHIALHQQAAQAMAQAQAEQQAQSEGQPSPDGGGDSPPAQ